MLRAGGDRAHRSRRRFATTGAGDALAGRDGACAASARPNEQLELLAAALRVSRNAGGGRHGPRWEPSAVRAPCRGGSTVGTEALANVRRRPPPNPSLGGGGGRGHRRRYGRRPRVDVADIRARPSAALHFGLDTLGRARAAGGLSLAAQTRQHRRPGHSEASPPRHEPARLVVVGAAGAELRRRDPPARQYPRPLRAWPCRCDGAWPVAERDRQSTRSLERRRADRHALGSAAARPRPSFRARRVPWATLRVAFRA